MRDGFGVRSSYAARSYSSRIVPPSFRLYYAINPMVGVIDGFRSALLGTESMPWPSIAIGAVVAAVLFVTGARYFRRTERLFADLV